MQFKDLIPPSYLATGKDEDGNTIYTGENGLLECRNPDGTVIWTERRASSGKIKRTQVYLTPRVRDAVLELLAKGMTFSEIGKLKGFPRAATILRRIGIDPDFKREVDIILKGRAYIAADEAYRISQKKISKDAAPGERLKFDALVWTAETCNPERFGKRTKVVGDPDAPVAFIIDTGVRRIGDEGAIETTGETVSTENKEIE